MATSTAQHILHTSIAYLKGVGDIRAELLKKELGIATYNDLLHTFPFRFIDKTKFNKIIHLTTANDTVQITGTITYIETLGQAHAKRIKATFNDGTGNLDLTWFNMLPWVEKTVLTGQKYLVFGKLSFFNGMPQITHPEIELLDDNFTNLANKNKLEPVYSSTEKLKAKMLNGRQIGKLTAQLFGLLQPHHILENLSQSILDTYKLMPRFSAFKNIHFPNNNAAYEAAVRRLKFEELFFSQLAVQQRKLFNKTQNRGFVFPIVGNAFTQFYNNHLPFTLTNAQKKVIKEIRHDTATGRQMNRLLQGDVGSGKTIVALITMLIAADNGYQSTLMAPTEILSRQHYEGLTTMLGNMPIKIMLLTGSVKVKQRRLIHAALLDGSCHILVGTHAIIEDVVQFKQLGFVVIDEQHRFGVAQRARLWAKASLPPHMLVMTATPIPRTLAMTAYGDLDCSIMDELPPGRTPIKTLHKTDDFRAATMKFVREQIDQGRQIYFIFPLIEESDKLDFENLMAGYDNVKAYFPEPKYYISMVHGRMKADLKNANMERFVNNTTQIMVSTTVIEVGVNVPNATVMVIESAERFGLSQLHQLRGRVGRGVHQSFCILLTSPKIGANTKQRMQIMVSTNNGFIIAEKDMELRGPGDIEGTRQSGMAAFKIANIIDDKIMLQAIHTIVENLLQADPNLMLPVNQATHQYLLTQKHKKGWGNIA